MTRSHITNHRAYRAYPPTAAPDADEIGAIGATTSIAALGTDLELLADLIAQRIESRPLAVDVAGACQLLGVGWDFWREHIAPEVPIVRVGRRKLVPVVEIERWLERNAETALPQANGHRGGRAS